MALVTLARLRHNAQHPQLKRRNGLFWLIVCRDWIQGRVAQPRGMVREQQVVAWPRGTVWEHSW